MILILYCAASLFIVVLMFSLWLERRQDFLNSCERFHAQMGFRHYLDPMATSDDFDKCIKNDPRHKKAQGGDKKGEL